MKELIPIITALIAFAGTIVGIVIGYRKWRKEQTSKRFSQFETDKQNAYKGLWQLVEDFNIKVRLEEIGSDDFSNHVQSLNVFLLKHGIYIDDEDRKLANEYAESVYNFQKVVRDSKIEEANVSLGKTEYIFQNVLDQVNDIKQAQELALTLRKELINKMRLVLGGKNG